MVLKNDPRPHFRGECRGTMIVWTLVQLHYTSQFHTFQGNHQSLQWNLCAAHVNNFSSNLVECVSGHHCGLVMFFRINNIELKCSFVQCRKYHKSWWNGAAELHISVDLLCGITAAELHNSVDLLCGTTDAEPRRRASQLAGKFTLWHNGRRAKQPGLIHAPGVARIFPRKIWRLNPK